MRQYKTITRYAVTHVDRDGMRTLSFANQGRNHFDTPEAAAKFLAAMLQNNNVDTLRSVYGDISTLAVRPVICYEHGDAVGIYFDE